MHLDPAGLSFALVALLVGSLATAVVNPRNREQAAQGDRATPWGRAVVVLVRCFAVVVLGVVVAAALLDLPGRPAAGGSTGSEVLGLVALLAAAVVVVHTTLVIQTLEREDRV